MRVISTMTRAGTDFLEFTPLTSLLRQRSCDLCHAKGISDHRASNSPVLPQSEEETVLHFESSQGSKKKKLIYALCISLISSTIVKVIVNQGNASHISLQREMSKLYSETNKNKKANHMQITLMNNEADGKRNKIHWVG